MFKREVLINLSCFFLLVMLSACSGDTNQSESQGLSYLRSIPADPSDNYMKNPFKMAFDGDSSVYISSHYFSKIFEFSLSGELRNTIGGEGKGPGEFNNPLGVDFFDESLFIMDTGNLRMQVLHRQDFEGQTFLMEDSFYDFTVHKDTVYGFTIQPIRQLDESHQQNLIKVLDDGGNQLFSFGDYLFYGKDGMTEVASLLKMRIHNRKLYVLYLYFPLLQVYSLQGKLLDEVVFDEEQFNRLSGGENDPEKAQKGNRIEMKSLYKTFWVDDSGIYLGLLEDYLKIEHRNHNGEFIRSYSYKDVSDSYSLMDLFIIGDVGEERELYVLNRDQYPMIHVFDMEE